MKIAYTHPFAWPLVRRGNERNIDVMSRHFAAAGHEVTSIASHAGARSVEREDGVTRILAREILPNLLGVLVGTVSFRIPVAILAESTLSFIGLGLLPPASSWGTLANDGWSAIKFYPHLILFPSLAIFLTILSFNFLGEGLRDALDPRT